MRGFRVARATLRGGFASPAAGQQAGKSWIHPGIRYPGIAERCPGPVTFTPDSKVQRRWVAARPKMTNDIKTPAGGTIHPFAKLTLMALAGVTCAACSSHPDVPAPTASAPPTSTSVAALVASAIPMQASASGATSVAPPSSALPSRAPSLRVILQRPAFAKAFAAMDGASALPAWVNTADQSQPSTLVQVGDQAMWLSRVCGVSGCQGGQLFVLTDPAAQKMQGLLVVADGTPGATVRQLTWLGQPDAALQSFLKAQTNRD